MVLISNSLEELVQLGQELMTKGKKVGLKINYSKSKILVNGRKQNVRIEGNEIEWVEEF